MVANGRLCSYLFEKTLGFSNITIFYCLKLQKSKEFDLRNIVYVL